MKGQRIIIWILLVLATMFIFNQKAKKPEVQESQEIAVSTTRESFSLYDEVAAKITNNTQNAIEIENKCPYPPLIIQKLEGDEFINLEAEAKDKSYCELPEKYIVNPNSNLSISFSAWNGDLFGELGEYRVGFKKPDSQNEVIFSNKFEIKERNFWGNLWREGFYRPIYNVLVFIIMFSPNHSLGVAVILLTFLLRLILLVPNRKAIESQKKMNELQPKLKALKEKYSSNQQKQAEETMKLWKEHKVNPFGSCLPMVIQLPIMIALYWVIRNGLSPHNNVLLYDFLGDFELTKINTYFLGLNLKVPNVFILPLLVGFFQYIQMRLTLVRSSKKKKTNPNKGKNGLDHTEIMNKMMLYFMPFMIAIFTASLPAGVGLYYGTSTAFGIGQQWFIFNKKPKEKINDVRVKKAEENENESSKEIKKINKPKKKNKAKKSKKRKK